MANEPCASCLRGRPWECQITEDGCNASMGALDNQPSGDPFGLDDPILPVRGEEGTEEESPSELGLFFSKRSDANLKDQQSTGRKRAAILFPLDSSLPCEWSKQKNCGGGRKPIVGCWDNPQTNRHHGPDKNTLNNDKGNVHRICATCHNRWHTLNDPNYSWEGPYPPHAPVAATELEFQQSERSWNG